MEPRDVWPHNAGKDEPSSGDESNAWPAGGREDAAQASRSGQESGSSGRGTGRFLYPVMVIFGVLFLIVLAAV